MPKSTKPNSAAAPAADSKLKRAKPKAVTYTTEWTDPATGEIHTLSIKHTPKYFDHADHLEVEGARQGRGKTPTAHPLSQTGYLSIFIAPLDLINAGGPVCHIDRQLADKLASKQFREASSKRAQGDLFAWAETHKAVTKRPAGTKATKPTAKPKTPKGRRPA